MCQSATSCKLQLDGGKMSKVRIAGFSLSVDGFGAGPEQSLNDPLGKRGPELFDWFFPTRTFQAMLGKDGGSEGVDEKYASSGNSGFGAFILGRNMFGPVRGEWPDENWKGWWGDTPPYHAPTFILTHYPRAPIVMEGGTTFHFVTGGIEQALMQARAAAGLRISRSAAASARCGNIFRRAWSTRSILPFRRSCSGEAKPC